MTRQQHLKALNKEIQKLNGIIDCKILQHSDYRKEATRHRELLKKIRREERGRSILCPFFGSFFSRV